VKIKFKLSLMMGAIMAGALGLTAVLGLFESSKISMELSLRSIDYLTYYQVAYWKGRMDRYIQILRSLSNIMADYETIDANDRRARLNDMMHGTLTSEPNLLQIYTVWKPNAIDGMDAQFIGSEGTSPTGQYATVYTRESGRIEVRVTSDISEAVAHFNGPNARMDRIENPIIRNIMGKDTYVVRMMVPITNPRTNEVVGGMGLLYDISAIQPVVNDCLNRYEEISATAIYANNGLILGHLVPNRIGRTLLEADDVLYGTDLHAVNTAVQRGEDFTTSQYSTVLSTDLIMIFHPFTIGNSNTTWTVMIGTSEAYVMHDINEMTFFIVLMISGVLIGALVIIYIAMNRISKPIVEVANTLKDIAEGEGDLTRTIVVKAKDEIGDLSKYFNDTMGKIKGLVINIRNESLVLSEIGTDLANDMTETAAAVNQITANLQSIKGRMINQSASVTETNATMEQITVNIDKLNKHVEKQTLSVSQSSSAIEEMLANIQSVTQTLIKNTQNVDELTGASEIGRNGLQDVATDIQEIARESEGLLEINAVMENIASQTNLLSMNAAIEAAHAGDAGKGFAVVADEIRKLAESSSEQSKTIGSVLKKIKESIDKITVSTENVLNKFEAIDNGIKTVAKQEEHIRNAMEEQGHGSKQILEAIGNVNETTLLVKSGTEEMLEGAQEVIREADNLEKTTQEITGGVNEMASGAEQINTAVNHINDLSNKNRDYIDLLSKEVARFKVD
jgi:methyl-accepting chemotaxis protein